ncbi:hypothetical protein DB346_00005 [Verrucomicrobia bacterium LW23]|nr:hypothetical protein DB346_00005 [Verrucomicrobia bacterium LW23]
MSPVYTPLAALYHSPMQDDSATPHASAPDAIPASPTPAARLRVVVFALAMVVLAAMCNAAMDKLSFHFDSSVFASPALEEWRPWLDPRLSWRNKWRGGDRAKGEAFPFSSTALVALTDAWHCLKSIAKSCLILALLAPFTLLYRLRAVEWAAAFLVLHVISGAVFELFFAVLLRA